MWTGSVFVIDKEITPGELLSFYALIGYFTGPVSQLIGSNKSIQSALIAADRLFEIMDLEREETTEKMDITSDLIGTISFKEVTFSYGSRVQVFKNFSIEFEKGKISALVGESGSGKSTIAGLLQGLYPIQSGNIFIGNYNLQYLTHKSLRSKVAAVPQEIQLFSGNVIDNIALGEFEPNIQRIVDIATQLGMMDFVQKLPNGFETQLGENGANISGGQKQRIAIARALYKNPDIIILDEATSSLDSKAESKILDTIQSLKEQGKTILIIAHRLTTIDNADTIFVLSEGQVVESGSHKDLMKNKKNYFELWNKQSLVTN